MDNTYIPFSPSVEELHTIADAIQPEEYKQINPNWALTNVVEWSEQYEDNNARWSAGINYYDVSNRVEKNTYWFDLLNLLAEAKASGDI